LAHFNVGFITRGVTQRSQAHHERHVAVKFFVDALRVCLGPFNQMDGNRRVFIHAAHQVLVQFLGHKWHGGRQETGKRCEGAVEHFIGGGFIPVRFALPETSAGAAQIPVGKLVHKGFDGSGCPEHVIGFVGSRHIAH